ncbi:unknown [Firmicutes bacterium CAG:137]|nr:unknown [Firmicutes bacterium CAG:137]
MPLNGLHHLTDHAVGQDHDGVTVVIGHVKGNLDIVRSLLNGGGGEDQVAVVAVAAAPGGLVIVALGGLDGAQAGTAAHHVHDDSRQLRAAHISDALLLQGDAGGGGGGHSPDAAAGSAVDHVDGGNLRLSLDEAAAHLGQVEGQIFRNFVLRGDGIAEEVFAAGTNGGLGNGLIAFPQFFLHRILLMCVLR